MKTIITLTNYGDACVDHLSNVLSVFNDEPVLCIFLQVRPIPGNYNDMMTLHKHSGRYGYFTEAFSQAVNQLKTQYAAKMTVRYDHIYGDSSAVFRNYVHHHGADLVIYDKQEWDQNPNRLNVFKMAKRCGCELMYISKENAGAREIPISSVLHRNDAPGSVVYKYSAVDRQLDELLNERKMISAKMNNLSRYFLNETILERMLDQAECSLLLLKK